MVEFFEYLQSKGITPRNNSIAKIGKMSDEQLLDLVTNAIGFASISHGKNTPSHFNFLANGTLSGGAFPCSEMQCRFSNISSLARNAVLYADTVFLTNPFERYYHHNTFDLYDRYEILSNIFLMYQFKPLFVEGIFQFASSIYHVCDKCNQKMKSLSRRYSKKLESLQWDILNKVFKDHTFQLKISPDLGAYVEMTGGNDIIHHSMIFTLVPFSDKSFLEKIKNTKPRKLGMEELIEVGIAGNIVNPIIDDLSNQHFYENFFNAHYLTNRNLDATLYGSLQHRKSVGKGKLIADALEHKLPFLENASLKQMIKLRKNEGEAFQVYRSSFSAFLARAKKRKELKQAFADEIQPEIERMNQTIKAARKLIMSDIKKDLIVGTTFVTAGLFTHILPPNIAQLVAGVGGVNYLGKFGDNAKKLVNIESEVSNNKYFFVWKLQKHLA